jgi:hypothetical protein
MLRSGEPGEAAYQAGLGPPTAKPKGIASTDDSESDEDKRVDDVVIHEYIVLGRQRRAPHQNEQDCPRGGGDAHPDTEQQRYGDAEQTEHEDPVHPACTRDGLVDAREGARGTAEEAHAGGPSIDPSVGGGRLVTEPERLVQEWPQKGPAQAQSGQRPQVGGSRGRGRLSRGRDRLRRGDPSNVFRSSNTVHY